MTGLSPMESGALPCIFCTPPTEMPTEMSLMSTEVALAKMSVSTVPGAAVWAGREETAGTSAPSAVLNCTRG